MIVDQFPAKISKEGISNVNRVHQFIILRVIICEFIMYRLLYQFIFHLLLDSGWLSLRGIYAPFNDKWKMNRHSIPYIMNSPNISLR